MLGSNRICLKNTVIATWREGRDSNLDLEHDFITNLVHSFDNSQLAASTTNNSIKILSRNRLEFERELMGHEESIIDMSYSSVHPQSLYSASRSGKILQWDVRCPDSSVSRSIVNHGREIYSFAVNGTDSLCAVGGEDDVYFYDLRKTSKQVGVSDDAHSDLVTSILFNDNKPSQLLSASEDGLICIHDTNAFPEPTEVVMNAECPVRSIGLFGPNLEKIWCCTGIETMSIWQLDTALRVLDLSDLRSVCSVDYLVGCFNVDATENLNIVGGSYGGELVVMDVNSVSGVSNIARSGSLTSAGHASIIRSYDWTNNLLATGGEDGRICSWEFGCENVQNMTNKSSSASVVRHGTKRKSRNTLLQPYTH